MCQRLCWLRTALKQPKSKYTQSDVELNVCTFSEVVQIEPYKKEGYSNR